MFSMETVQNATLPGWKAVGVFSRRGLGRARATACLRVSCVLPDSRGAVCRGVFSPEEGSGCLCRVALGTAPPSPRNARIHPEADALTLISCRRIWCRERGDARLRSHHRNPRHS